MDLIFWFLRRPGLFARAQPKQLLEDMAQDRPIVHSNVSTLSIFLTLDQRCPTHLPLEHTLHPFGVFLPMLGPGVPWGPAGELTVASWS